MRACPLKRVKSCPFQPADPAPCGSAVRAAARPPLSYSPLSSDVPSGGLGASGLGARLGILWPSVRQSERCDAVPAFQEIRDPRGPPEPDVGVDAEVRPWQPVREVSSSCFRHCRDLRERPAARHGCRLQPGQCRSAPIFDSLPPGARFRGGSLSTA